MKSRTAQDRLRVNEKTARIIQDTFGEIGAIILEERGYPMMGEDLAELIQQVTHGFLAVRCKGPFLPVFYDFGENAT